jgi:hypothetical protein
VLLLVLPQVIRSPESSPEWPLQALALLARLAETEEQHSEPAPRLPAEVVLQPARSASLQREPPALATQVRQVLLAPPLASSARLLLPLPSLLFPPWPRLRPQPPHRPVPGSACVLSPPRPP